MQKFKKQITRLDDTSFNTAFDLKISIQNITQKERISPSYKKSKLDEDWEMHSVTLKKKKERKNQQIFVYNSNEN